jgi:hypothetical protein
MQIRINTAEASESYTGSRQVAAKMVRRKPDSAARAYLTVIAKEPAVVRRALASD